MVLRDYHVDNMIWLPDRPGVAACGLLDFQDARLGPVSYDLVSLFEDARRDVPPALTAKLLKRYLDAFPELDREAFAASYAIMGAQRGAKILGIFTRLDRRDGEWWLTDLDSRNGTLLNGVPITKSVPLADGDVIGVGQVELKLEIED